MFALIDGNSFYASCEQVFRPDLRGNPIVVLSNNDGCVIARNAEAKALSIKMGLPYFQILPILKKHQVAVFSSNYELYGDLSARMMASIASLVPQIEVYSIDECFADLSGLTDFTSLGHSIRNRVFQWVGIPNCVGIGPTKTLAKFCNHLAKKNRELSGVCNWMDLSEAERQTWMQQQPVSEVWGIGHRLAKSFAHQGIETVLDFYRSDVQTIRSQYGVVVERTLRELQGLACIDLSGQPEQQKQLVRSRSFPQCLYDLDVLRAAIAFHIRSGAETLRAQNQKAHCIGVQLHSNYFDEKAVQYHPFEMLTLPVASCDTLKLNQAAQALLKRLFRPGIGYKKAGILLTGLVDGQSVQSDMWAQDDSPKRLALMLAMDSINQRFGRHSIHCAVENVHSWQMKREKLSPCYTTRWRDLPLAK